MSLTDLLSFPSSCVCFYSTSSIIDANEEPVTTKTDYVNFSNLFGRSTRHKQISPQRGTCSVDTYWSCII